MLQEQNNFNVINYCALITIIDHVGVHVMKIDLMSTHPGKYMSWWLLILATTKTLLKISLCPDYQHMIFPTYVCQRIRQKFCKQKLL